MRLIDKDELIRAFNDECGQECAICNCVIENDDHSLECELIRNFKEQPEIVRCRDCKHRPIQTEPGKEGFTLEFPDYICPCQCDDGFYSWYPKDDWFCHNGERSVDTE